MNLSEKSSPKNARRAPNMKMFKAQPGLPMNDAINSSQPSNDDGAVLLLRIATVVRITGLGRSTIYRLMADDQFPAPVRVTSRLVAWRRADLQCWVDSKSAVTYAPCEAVNRGVQRRVLMLGARPIERGARAGRG
jgi:prophage regulatory protein